MEYYQWLTDNEYGYAVSAAPSTQARLENSNHNNLQQDALSWPGTTPDVSSNQRIAGLLLAKARRMTNASEALLSQEKALNDATQYFNAWQKSKMQCGLRECRATSR